MGFLFYSKATVIHDGISEYLPLTALLDFPTELPISRGIELWVYVTNTTMKCRISIDAIEQGGALYNLFSRYNSTAEQYPTFSTSDRVVIPAGKTFSSAQLKVTPDAGLPPGKLADIRAEIAIGTDFTINVKPNSRYQNARALLFKVNGVWRVPKKVYVKKDGIWLT